MNGLNPRALKWGNRRRIFINNGFWWYSDPGGKGTIRLDPMFNQSGWNVGRLGVLLGLGDRTLARMIDESVGMKGKMWLRHVRMVMACHLLRENSKIEAISHTLGFSQHADFTREFKKLVGVLPSEYVRAELRRATSPHGYS